MGTPLTAVKGIGPNTANLLMTQGIHNVEDLAIASMNDLSAISGFGRIRAQQVKQAAVALLASHHSAPTLDEAVHTSSPRPTTVTSDPPPPQVAIASETVPEHPTGAEEVKKKSQDKRGKQEPKRKRSKDGPYDSKRPKR